MNDVTSREETPAAAVAEAAPSRRLRVRPLLALIPYVMRYRGQVAAAMVALLIAAAATLVVPLAVRRMIDFGFSAERINLIDQYFAVMLAVAAVLAIASATRYYLVTNIGERVVADLRAAVFAHLTALAPAFFDTAKTGELTSRLTADTTQIKSAVGSSVSVALRNLVLFFGSSIMMAVTSPRLSFFVILAIPIIVLPLVAFGRLVRRRSRSAQDTLADASAYAAELIGAIRTLQAFTNEQLAQSRFASAVERAFVAARDSTRARALLTAIIIFLVFGSVVVVLWVGAQDVLAGRTTPGTLGQFILYAVFAASGLGQLSEVWGELSQASGAAERLMELMAVEPGIKAPPHPKALPEPARGEVAFETVRFAYPTRGDVPVLDSVSFSVRQGEKVAIVGPSGAGKSTIFHLVLRFYDVGAGSVTFDGIRVSECDPHDLRRRIALVPQDVVVFGASVAENIRFGRLDATDADVARAAELAGAVPVHRSPAAALRYADRRARRHAVRRPAPAHRDRARDPARCAAAAARRGDLVARCRKRDAGLGCVGAADAGTHHAGDRASPRDRAVMRPDPGARSRPHRRAGHARAAVRDGRPLRAAGEAAVRFGVDHRSVSFNSMRRLRR